MSRTLVVTSTSYCIRTKPRGLDRRIPYVEYNPTSREEYDAKLAELQANKVRIIEHYAIDQHASVGTDDCGVIVARRADGTPLWARSLSADTWDELDQKIERDIEHISRPDVKIVDIYHVTEQGMDLQDRRELAR